MAGNRTDWARVVAGNSHTCARRTTGRLYCWGWNDYGQVGHGGANTDRLLPVEVAGNRTDWGTVSAGLHHTCARRSNGRLYCWGSNVFGELGDPGAATAQSTPVEVDF